MKQILISILIFAFSIPVFSQVTVLSEYQGEDVIIEARADEPGSYTVELIFSELSGFQTIFGDKAVFAFTYPFTGTYRLKREGTQPTRCNFRYRFNRGKYNAKPDKDYPYLLPVKAGKVVGVNKFTNIAHTLRKTTTDSILGMTFNYMETDTVYAIRSGLVVKIENRQQDAKQVDHKHTTYDRPSRSITTVEHKDGTIVRYVCITEADNLLQPGDRVIAGQPIALFTNREQTHPRLGIQISSVDKTLKHVILIPSFYTEEGVQKLDFNQRYRGVSSEEIIKKELTKQEKKKLGLK